MTDKVVYVLVLNWNGREHLEECFASLLASSYPHCRFVLVDNASTDASIRFVRERFGHDPRVKIYALDGNYGWSGGNNRAIARALEEGADYLFLLNNDTAVSPDAVARLVAAAETDPSVGAWAPKMVLFDTPCVINSVGLVCSRIGASWDRGIGELDEGQYDAPSEVVGICGGAFFLPAPVVQRVGFFPERFEVYLDDLELCLRIWDAGYRVMTCPSAVVRHKFSASVGTGARARYKYYLNTRNRLWVMWRHFPLRQIPLCLFLFLYGEMKAIGKAVKERAFWRIGAHLRAWLAGFLYLPEAIQFRISQRKQAVRRGAFWPHIERKRLFCPHVVLPQRGWYPAVMHEGKAFFPMSREAWVPVTAGEAQITIRQFYPSLGALHVTMAQEETLLCEVVTDSEKTVTVQFSAGRLIFRAQRIFKPAQTGLDVAVGCWVSSPLLNHEQRDSKS